MRRINLGINHKIFQKDLGCCLLVLILIFFFFFFFTITFASGASWVAQTVKNLSAMRETWVQSLGLEDPLEKGIATHSNILAWRIPWTEKPGGLQSMGSQRVGHH